MNVKELKELLEPLQDDVLIVLSRDEEGNGFSPLADTSLQIYVPTSSWYGEIKENVLTSEMIEQGFTDEDIYHGTNGQSAIVLWPTN